MNHERLVARLFNSLSLVASAINVASVYGYMQKPMKYMLSPHSVCGRLAFNAIL